MRDAAATRYMGAGSVFVPRVRVLACVSDNVHGCNAACALWYIHPSLSRHSCAPCGAQAVGGCLGGRAGWLAGMYIHNSTAAGGGAQRVGPHGGAWCWLVPDPTDIPHLRLKGQAHPVTAPGRLCAAHRAHPCRLRPRPGAGGGGVRRGGGGPAGRVQGGAGGCELAVGGGTKGFGVRARRKAPWGCCKVGPTAGVVRRRAT